MLILYNSHIQFGIKYYSALLNLHNIFVSFYGHIHLYLKNKQFNYSKWVIWYSLSEVSELKVQPTNQKKMIKDF